MGGRTETPVLLSFVPPNIVVVIQSILFLLLLLLACVAPQRLLSTTIRRHSVPIKPFFLFQISFTNFDQIQNEVCMHLKSEFGMQPFNVFEESQRSADICENFVPNTSCCEFDLFTQFFCGQCEHIVHKSAIYAWLTESFTGYQHIVVT